MGAEIHMQTQYLTRNFHLATFLTARSHQLLRLEGERGSRIFVFANVDPSEVDAFHANTAVPVKTLLQASRELKARLRDDEVSR